MIDAYDATRTLSDIPDLHPSRIALISEGRALGYPALSAAANRVAHALARLGLARGARVAFVGHDSEKSYELLFGCARAGMVFVPVNWKLGEDEAAWIVDDAEAEVLFVTAGSAALAAGLLARCARLRAVVQLDGAPAADCLAYPAWRDAAPATRPADPRDPETPVIQVYTSGTSGRPKGVVLAHRGFIELVREVVRAGDEFIDWRPGDVALLALPTFHVGGLWWALHGLINGATGIVLPAFSGAAALEAIVAHRVTKLAFVPAMLRFLLSEPGCAQADLSSVDLVVYGGSPMPAPLLELAQARLRCRFAQNYGMSETSNMAIFLPPSEHAALGSARKLAAGRPLRGVAVRIVDRAGRELGPGEPGEILFRTSTRMLGYWKQPDATAETIVDGWVHSGDAGYLDADGYLSITDRIKDLIISAGENIYPAELEQMLLSHPGIAEAAVIGVPDARWGEVPVAYVVAARDAGLTRSVVLAHARARVAGYKMLYDVIFVDQLPRNSTGKVLKRVLREPHWAGRERQVN